MARIVAARFETGQEAEQAVAALAKAGIRRDKLASFEVLPAGQHALYPIGGDAAHDRGTRKSGRGAMAGAALGALAGMIAGWLIAEALVAGISPAELALGTVAGAAVGAYVGSFVGALARTRRPNPARASTEEPVSRKSGPLVAAEVDEHPQQYAAACDVFVGLDAFEIEEADGRIRDGDWVDFDPRLPPHIIVPTQRSAAGHTIVRRRDRQPQS
ncbi:MAG: hypothetical protein KJ025_04185 [Burkholderiales bacterium]|nr:hypothetical protein [Burkholderiales bacterium]